MKKIFFLLQISAILFACGETSEQANPEEGQLSMENSRLLEEAREKDSIIDAYFRTINEIEDNLDLIKQSERLVTISIKDEAGTDRKNQIAEDIKLIGELMLKNKERVNELEKQLKGSSIKSKELEKLIQRMELQLEEKNRDLEHLRTELVKLNNSFENLFLEYNHRLDELDLQTGKLNTAYYAIGTVKELRENNVIVKEGGVIGIGKTVKLVKDLNKSYFTKINIMETKSIELFGRDAKLLSSHAGNTFSIEKKGDNEVLIITNPEEFWSVSRYLVVAVSN